MTKHLNEDTFHLFEKRIGMSYKEMCELEGKIYEPFKENVKINTEKRNKLSHIDRFILISEDVTALSILTSVMILDRHISHQQICKRLLRLSKNYYQFNSIVRGGTFL